MGIKQTLDVINEMEREGVIGRWAIGGAVAAYNYVEPALTEDIDIFVSFQKVSPTGLVSLTPILAFLQSKGYAQFKSEGVLVGDWIVQFVPVADDLDAEALSQAEDIELKTREGSVQARVFRPEHLVAIALRVGRPKDSLRILQFLQEQAVDTAKLKSVLSRFKLLEAWAAFCRTSGIKDSLGAK